jgi:hypothetical protein
VGSPSVSGAVDAAGEFRIAVRLDPNQTTRVWARAVDVAGNASACTTEPLAIVQDEIPPAEPQLISIAPGPLSNSVIRPELSGTAERDARVVLYEGEGCAIELPFASPADASGKFHIEARVDPDTVTVFSARAFDAAGNGSSCSAQSISYEHDDLAPAPPVPGRTTPLSPSPMATPVLAAAAEARSTVTLFAAARCAGAPVAEAVAAADGSVTFSPAVARNAATTFSLSSMDAAGNRSACSTELTYVHDDIPPAGVANASFVPAPPAQTLNPTVKGFVPDHEAGEQVELVDWATRTRLARVEVSADGFFSAAIAVRENTFTGVLASTIDAAGNASPLKDIGGFVNDTKPPPAPTVVTTSVPTPARSETTFEVIGTAGEFGSRIDLWSDPACSISLGSPPGSWEFFPQGVWYHAVASVLANSSVDVYATSTDAAGNRSECSTEHVGFANASSGPAWSAPLPAPFGLAEPPVTGGPPAMGPDGTAVGMQFNGDGAGNVLSASFLAASPGGSWGPSEIFATPSAARDMQNTRVVPLQGRAALTLWSENSVSASEVRSRLRAADGTWGDVQLVSQHLSPIAWVWSITSVADRAGGAWAMWRVGDVLANGVVEELWAAHYSAASGWAAPVRISNTGGFAFARLAAGASGHAAIAYDEDSFPVRSARITFYDPSSGWGPAELLEGGYFQPIRMDDQGRLMTITWSRSANGDTVIRSLRHVPGAGWQDAVERPPVSLLDGVALEATGGGDAALAWIAGSGPPYELVVQTYSDAAGWAAPKPQGKVSALPALSMVDDGSVWMLVDGVQPHLQVQHGHASEPTWLLRFDPAGGWLRPQLVIDDAAACFPGSFCKTAKATLLRSGSGNVLLLWGNFGPPPTGAYALMRWFR